MSEQQDTAVTVAKDNVVPFDGAEDFLDVAPRIPSMKEMREELDNIESVLNLHYVYVRPYELVDVDVDGDELFSQTPSQYGGLTIVYDLDTTLPNQNTVMVSLAWCNPNEKFKKRAGRYFAALRYFNGDVVPIRLPERGHIDRQLQQLFSPLV